MKLEPFENIPKIPEVVEHNEQIVILLTAFLRENLGLDEMDFMLFAVERKSNKGRLVLNGSNRFMVDAWVNIWVHATPALKAGLLLALERATSQHDKL